MRKMRIEATDTKGRIKAFLKRCKKPFLYAVLGMVPFVILWIIVVWLLLKCT